MEIEYIGAINARRTGVAYFFALLLLSPVTAVAKIACLNPLSGTFDFGTTPTACNVSTFESAATVTSHYGPVIFDDSQPAEQEKVTYMSNLFPFYRDLGTAYIRQRNPKVSAAEISGFLEGIYALAMQESVWTHYRVGSDHIVRFLRGDSLNGFGFMQIDDRYHLANINAGDGYDLKENMLFGFDIYYSGWVQAASQKCVGSATNYTNRARAAWAAYNAGPGQICRWTKKNAYDPSYYSHLTQKKWLGVVSNPNAPSPLEVSVTAKKTQLQVKQPASTAVWSEPDYRMLRKCPAVSCGFVNAAVRPGQSVGVLASYSGWIQAQTNEGRGWVRQNAGVKPMAHASAADFVERLSVLANCAESKLCAYPETDPRSYDLALGQDVKSVLFELADWARSIRANSESLAEIGRQFLAWPDGHVREAALDVLATQAPSAANMQAILQNVIAGIDSKLVTQGLLELERYTSSVDRALIGQALQQAMSTGSPFVAREISEHIAAFVAN